MRATTPENPISTAYAQNKDTIDAFVAGVAGAWISEQARLNFAPAQEGSLERAFQQQYDGLVVTRSLFGYYDDQRSGQARANCRIDLVDSPIGLPNLEVDVTFFDIDVDREVWSAADYPQSTALHGALIHNLRPSMFAVAMTFPPSFTSVAGVGTGRFNSVDESWPVAITAATLLNLGAGAIKKTGLVNVNRLARKRV